jgi:hypothetical protein
LFNPRQSPQLCETETILKGHIYVGLHHQLHDLKKYPTTILSIGGLPISIHSKTADYAIPIQLQFGTYHIGVDYPWQFWVTVKLYLHEKYRRRIL